MVLWESDASGGNGSQIAGIAGIQQTGRRAQDLWEYLTWKLGKAAENGRDSGDERRRPNEVPKKLNEQNLLDDLRRVELARRHQHFGGNYRRGTAE